MCKACTQTNTRRPLQAVEMGTPSPRSEQLHAMSSHTNDIRAHTDRNTTANAPGNLHTHEQSPRTTPRAHSDRHTITQPGFRISLLSRG